ncbi:MAG TPA: DNA replication/repair protein RecF [Steroidobacteraceae bacterium]|nr:DNA replication/repair protein RecF [Steroidobacteraceae bacterium]
MALRRLQLTDFRCLQTATLELDPRFTLISGANASGKTSLLEAIYVLGRGRSFRTRRLEYLIRRGAQRFIVFGEVERSGHSIPLGVDGSRQGIRGRIAGRDADSLAELTLNLPVQIIDPEVHKLIEEGPMRRRRFLDWGVFHVEPGFVAHWQRYQQALQQRNAALLAGQTRDLVGAWRADLIRHGLAITAARSRYAAALGDIAAAICRNLLGCDLLLTYRRGWPQELDLEEALDRSWSLDLQRGSTQVGPHRGELGVRVGGLTAREHVSRGQQKLLAAGLLIAQLRLFPADAPMQPTLLLDDPAAELDHAHLTTLIEEVLSLRTQLVVTTLHQEFAAFGLPGKRIQIDAGMLHSL